MHPPPMLQPLHPGTSEPLMKMWMSSTRYLPTVIPTRVHRIWRGHNIPANAYKHCNNHYNVQNIKSFTHPVMRKGPKSIGESHSATCLATWPSIAHPRKSMATQLESRGLRGSLTKITPSPCLAPMSDRS